LWHGWIAFPPPAGNISMKAKPLPTPKSITPEWIRKQKAPYLASKRIFVLSSKTVAI